MRSNTNTKEKCNNSTQLTMTNLVHNKVQAVQRRNRGEKCFYQHKLWPTIHSIQHRLGIYV